ncbi:MAG: prepilin-type N-terminal cleavage/methylation domain-containing protein [Patescibacteria group bacterium]|jgi:prepilin-type N-terminal cleavage/methylation domain-containing protein|nr:prepilin-type N-terminal cleavage/methylation domain-containing protein [Patescibacteria group bacterium]
MKLKKGVTLVELLIAIALMGTIVIAISTMYIIGFKTFREELAQSQLESNAQTILDEITNDTKNAQSVEETYDSYASGANSIILKTPAIDSNKAIIYSGNSMLFDRIIYYYENNKIHKITFAELSSIRYRENNIDKVIDNKTLQLNFIYDPDAVSATLVTINVSSHQQVGKINRTISLVSKARLRNHL